MTKYYSHLSRVQNKHTIIDIITITGLMNKTEKLSHLLRYAEIVSDTDAIAYHADMVTSAQSQQ